MQAVVPGLGIPPGRAGHPPVASFTPTPANFTTRYHGRCHGLNYRADLTMSVDTSADTANRYLSVEVHLVTPFIVSMIAGPEALNAHPGSPRPGTLLAVV